jgi:hypothetical protein
MFLNFQLARGVPPPRKARYTETGKECMIELANTHLPECWLHMLVCPRRYRALLPSRTRPFLFGCD